MPEQTPASSKDFTLEDARKALVLRTYVVTIEKKVLALLASDQDGSSYRDAVVAIRTMIARLDELQTRQAAIPCTCWDDYECCSGICEPWCS